MGTTFVERVELPQWSLDRQPIQDARKWTLRELMDARCVAIRELGRTSGTSQDAVQRILRETGVPTMRVRRLIAAALGVETDMVRWPERKRQEMHA